MFGNRMTFLGNHHGWNKQTTFRGVDNPHCVPAIGMKIEVIQAGFGESGTRLKRVPDSARGQLDS